MPGPFVFRRALGLITAAALSAALLAAGCGEDATAPPPQPPASACSPESIVAADFALPDVNPSSTTYEDTLAPRQYLGMISAWYFGHST